MSQDYRQTIQDICAAAGIPDLAPEMADAGVSGTTLGAAIRAAQLQGASDLRQAVREHQGVAAQMAAPKAGQHQPQHRATGADDGWAAAFARAAPAKPDADATPANADHADNMAAALERAQG